MWDAEVTESRDKECGGVQGQKLPHAVQLSHSVSVDRPSSDITHLSLCIGVW